MAVQYAGFWIRFVARIIDGVTLLIPAMLIGAAASGSSAIVLGFAIYTAYYLGFWMAKGATPGKMIVNTRIVTVSGEPLDFGTSFLRYIGLIASALTLGIGYLMIAFRKDKRGLHDLIAGTMVVKT